MTLTELSFYVRKYYPFVILGVLFFLIIFYALQLVFIVLNANNKPAPYINPIFNQIKKPYLSEASSSAGLHFTLDTIEGKPITATDTARVFYLPQPETKFGYREKIYLIAKSFGIDTEKSTYRLLGSDAVFADDTQKLTIDIKNFNFTYQYNFENDPELLSKIVPPMQSDSESKATQFLQTVDRFPQELSQGTPHTTFFKFDPTTKTMTQLDENFNANMAEVDFYRPDVDAQPKPIPIVSPHYFNSQNYVLLAFFPNSQYKILRAQVKFFEQSPDQIGVYPLRTGDDAYLSLKEGNGMIISNPQNLSNITIRKMFLGYLDPDVYQEYLQPIYVFIGDGNFVSYVPAVGSTYSVE